MELLIKLIGGLGLIVLSAIIFAIPTLLLWNWLMPDLFGIKVITLWQAIGVNFLASILFKGSSSSNNK